MAADADLRKILLVEDDPDIQMVARLALESLGSFEVATCGSAREAVERAPGFRPQLVLMDLVLPDLDGIATVAALRELPELAAVPVVFLTARAEAPGMETVRPLGVIVKPFDPMSLSDTIRELWSRRGASD